MVLLLKSHVSTTCPVSMVRSKSSVVTSITNLSMMTWFPGHHDGLLVQHIHGGGRRSMVEVSESWRMQVLGSESPYSRLNILTVLG